MAAMFLLDLTLPTPAENLALDEALLEEAERAGQPHETLRLWEPAAPMVVVGRSSRLEQEVQIEACRQLGVPILRRTSGGAAVVTGPGCLMYAVVLSYEKRPELRAVDRAHRFVLNTIVAGLEEHAPSVRCRGTSDLTLGHQKFSGNSVRCRREHFLYHGTLLYNFRLELIECCLRMPPRQPTYREGRAHGEFVANLPVAADALRQSLIAAWHADRPSATWPEAETARLVAERYSHDEWHGLR